MARFEMKLTERDEADLKRLCELERVGRADAVRRAVFFRLKELEPEKAMLRGTDAREPNDALGRRRQVYARDAETVTTDPTAGPLVGEAVVHERVTVLEPEHVAPTTAGVRAMNGFFDEAEPRPGNPRLEAARRIHEMAKERVGSK